MAGVIKAIMVLKKNQIPPQLNFINPKPSLRLQERGIEVCWPVGSLPPIGAWVVVTNNHHTLTL